MTDKYAAERAGEWDRPEVAIVYLLGGGHAHRVLDFNGWMSASTLCGYSGSTLALAHADDPRLCPDCERIAAEIETLANPARKERA